MTRAGVQLAAAFVLLWRFILAAVRSGWQITWIILRPTRGVEAGLVEYSYTPLSAGGVLLLACLICLTPGTTIVEVRPRERLMIMHLLDLRQREATLREIRERFEPLVRQLFPKKVSL